MRTIDEYYKRSLASAKGNLRRRGDSYLAAVDMDQLVGFYYSMYKLPIIVLVDGGKPKVIADNPSSASDSINSIKATIRFNIEKEQKADLAIKLEPSKTEEEEQIIACDENGFFIRVNLSPQSAKQALEEYERMVSQLVARKNAEIESNNQSLKRQLIEVITQYKSKLKAQTDIIDQLSEIIPLTKRENPLSPVIPLAKKEQVIINPPRPRIATYPKIQPKILNSIIDVIVKGGLTFEAAPETFLKLDEEDLRNILISFLNGNFELFATAEAFNKLGKTDISLRYSGDNLFVAECKFWRAPGLYSATIDQLFRYLTWRENIGVLITFVKEKDLTAIIGKAKEATSSHATFINDSMKDRSDSYFVSCHRFPEDKEKTVEVHHLVFTIHSPRM